LTFFQRRAFYERKSERWKQQEVRHHQLFYIFEVLKKEKNIEGEKEKSLCDSFSRTRFCGALDAGKIENT
jgi:hypothetical protein